jgi:hypothetical protein
MHVTLYNLLNSRAHISIKIGFMITIIKLDMFFNKRAIMALNRSPAPSKTVAKLRK